MVTQQVKKAIKKAKEEGKVVIKRRTGAVEIVSRDTGRVESEFSAAGKRVARIAVATGEQRKKGSVAAKAVSREQASEERIRALREATAREKEVKRLKGIARAALAEKKKVIEEAKKKQLREAREGVFDKEAQKQAEKKLEAERLKRELGKFRFQQSKAISPEAKALVGVFSPTDEAKIRNIIKKSIDDGRNSFITEFNAINNKQITDSQKFNNLKQSVVKELQFFDKKTAPKTAFVNEAISNFVGETLIFGASISESASSGIQLANAYIKGLYSDDPRSKEIASSTLDKNVKNAPQFGKELVKNVAKSLNPSTPEGVGNILFLVLSSGIGAAGFRKIKVPARTIKKITSPRVLKQLAKSSVKKLTKDFGKKSLVINLLKRKALLRRLSRKAKKPTLTKVVKLSTKKTLLNTRKRLSAARAKLSLAKKQNKAFLIDKQQRLVSKLESQLQAVKRPVTKQQSNVIVAQQKTVRAINNNPNYQATLKALEQPLIILKNNKTKLQYYKELRSISKQVRIINKELKKSVPKRIDIALKDQNIILSVTNRRVLVNNMVRFRISSLQRTINNSISKLLNSLSKSKNQAALLLQGFKKIRADIKRLLGPKEIRLFINKELVAVIKKTPALQRALKKQRLIVTKAKQRVVGKTREVSRVVARKKRIIKKRITTLTTKQAVALRKALGIVSKKVALPKELVNNLLAKIPKRQVIIKRKSLLRKFLDKELRDTNKKIDSIIKKATSNKQKASLLRRKNKFNQDTNNLLQKVLDDNIVVNPRRIAKELSDYAQLKKFAEEVVIIVRKPKGKRIFTVSDVIKKPKPTPGDGIIVKAANNQQVVLLPPHPA